MTLHRACLAILAAGLFALGACDGLRTACGGSGPGAALGAGVEHDAVTGATKFKADAHITCGAAP